MRKSEIAIYVCAAAIIAIFVSETPFSNDFINLVGGISAALVLIGFVALAAALLLRRFKIWNNRKLYKEKAEAVEPSQEETVKKVIYIFAIAWCALVIVGTIKTLIQSL